MTRTPTATPGASEADLLLRLWGQQKLTPTLARALLNLAWSEADESRMDELATKNREGVLHPAERHELDTYVRFGLTLSILQSRARKRLKKPSATGNGRG